MKSLQLPPSSAPRPRIPLLLRMRTQPKFWQRLQTWWQSCWQWLQTPRIVVQPPLQPARHKPFPARPHQHRRQAVFAALDAAPSGLTRRQLIAHVRTVTGVGCSEKLITQWRRERKSEGEMGRKGDGGMKAKRSTMRRWRAVQLRLFLVCMLLGASLPPLPPIRSVAAQEVTISPAPGTSPPISNLQSLISNSSSPRLLRIKLTLHDPRELRIKAGDEVNAGDVLSDQRPARQRLLVQKRALQCVLQHLHTQQQLTTQSLRQLQSLGFDLPPTSFAAEQAAIQRAKAEAVATNRAVEIQRQKLEVVSGQWSVIGQESSTSLASTLEGEASAAISRPLTTDHRPLIQAHETAKLTQAEDKQHLTQAEIKLHHAKLITAQEARAFAAQQHRVEVTRQILSVRQQQQQIEIELARLTAQLAELDLQLANLTAIRAPFAGTIKRIEWEDMNDETITVLVYLAVGN